MAADQMTPAEAFAARVRAEALESWRCLKCHTLKWRGFPCKACGYPDRPDDA